MENIPFKSPYTPNTGSDRRQMLEVIGVSDPDELFEDIPEGYRNPVLDLPGSMSEMELSSYANQLSKMNITPGEYACFLGAGSYRHHIPAIVSRLAGRSEYMTSYTPYQPEVSQGTLQTEYEFQTLCSQLTGMEVANAGMYDGSTSLAEGALMAARVTRRDKIAVLDTVSQRFIEVLHTYTRSQGITVEVVSSNDTEISEGTAALIVQTPNFYGYIEDVDRYSKLIHDKGGLFVVYVDPVSLGMFKPPSDYDADIVAAEGQAIGIPPTFGGPYVGIFACKERYIRQMPGRIVGKTVDSEGKTAYVLTLQTREQHIRREKATSNICTSVALIALMTTIYMAALGKSGMKQLAQMSYHKAHYAASLIDQLPRYKIPIDGIFFREFVVQCPVSPVSVNEQLMGQGIIGGLDVSDRYDNGMLVCVTDVNTKEEIDMLVKSLAEIGDSG
ncbi:MAG: aminomethyl-transferring glycine dehydrogenase subunit GcvPA [Chloroflexota bacterium]|nr:aminomethyl-transferring glycine dehydrogenase subunit GcvPA [Chloroflexota bacterium]